MDTRSDSNRVQSVGQFVHERCKANRLTQIELAELAGVGLRFLKELEAGKPTVRMDTVNAVLAPFGKQLGVVDRPRAIVVKDDGEGPDAFISSEDLECERLHRPAHRVRL